MKRTILCTLCFLFFSLFALSISAAGTLQEAFDRGNDFYEAGKYQEALEVYQEAIREGVHWKLYYNMGNCYYKMNRFLDAKINYLRADRLNPFDDSIAKNINIVNKQFKDKIPGESLDFIARVNRKIESFIPVNIVSVFLLISIFVLNLFVFLLIKNGKTKILVYGISFSLVITLLLFSYHIYRVEKAHSRDTAVITTGDAVLRSGPGESNTILFKVNPGMKVRIIEENRGWLQVSASKEIAGWVHTGHIERI